MKVFHSLDELSGQINNAAVTIGSFDGVHAGHRAILLRLNNIAREISGESTLITFWPHPRKVLYPEQIDLKLINSTEEKIELLSETGLQNLIVAPFTIEFSQTSSCAFVKHFLVERLNSKVIVVGPNHHFGHNRMGDFSYLYGLGKELGFRVEEISMLDIENEIISSTKIRKALFEGNIQKANAYLDKQYFIKGCIKQQTEFFDEKPVLLCKLECTEPEKLLPPAGFYASRIIANNFCAKAVALIRTGQDAQPEVLFLPVEKVHYEDFSLEEILYGNLFFYKKLMLIDSMHPVQMTRQLSEATEAITELIF